MADVTCPRCGSKTYRLPERLGWRITKDGIFNFDDADFCTDQSYCHWKKTVVGSGAKVDR